MSVEIQLEITATADISQRVEKDVEIDVEGSFMQGEDSSAAENTVVAEVPETGGGRGAAPAATSAIDWFKGLTPEEQAGAITFSDGAFLGTFLAFASPWSLTTPTPSSGDESPGRDVGKLSTRSFLKLNLVLRSEDRRLLYLRALSLSLSLRISFGSS
jgi:hypothetical protein